MFDTTNPLRVGKARVNQRRLVDSGRYCSLRADIAADVNRNRGHQIRIRPADQSAPPVVYTLDSRHEGGPPVRMGKKGRQKVDHDGPFNAVITPFAPRHDLSLDEANARDELCEVVWDTGQDHLIVCAPHGGNIESHTAQAAKIVRKELGGDRASVWALHGFGQDAFSRWHVKSGNIHPTSFPGLSTVAYRGFRHAVSFHVWNGSEILVGGRAPTEFREELANRISAAIDGRRTVVTDHDAAEYMAVSEENFVNWLPRDGGVQIELTPRMTQGYRKRIARAVAGFYATKLSNDDDESERAQSRQAVQL